MHEPSQSDTGTRSSYWDNIKGILIFLVVLGHFLWPYWGLGVAGFVVGCIYLFHMPAFVFVSGYFSRSAHSRSRASLVRLAVLYVVMNSALMLVDTLLLDGRFALLTPYYSAWYLLSLISWRLATPHFKARWPILISVVIGVIVGWCPDVSNVLALSRTVAFFPFFLAGYLLPKDRVEAFWERRTPLTHLKGILVLLCAFLIAMLLIAVIGSATPSDLLMDGYSTPTGPLLRLTVYVVAALVIASLVLLIPNRRLPLLCQWGRNSLAIYVLHRFVTLCSPLAFPVAGYSDRYILFALIASMGTAGLLGLNAVSHVVGEVMRLFEALFSRLSWHYSPGTVHR